MSDHLKKVKWSKDDALVQLSRWCAVQDRCHSEVRTRLIEHQVYGHDLEEVISQLITDGFLNEERFAINYARGKNRMNQWGTNKIKLHLKQKGVSPYCINKALKALDQDEYIQIISSLISKKWPTIKGQNEYEKKHKLTQYLLQKGYQYEELRELINEL